MVEKKNIFYFGVFVLVVFAFIFHVTAMGHHHWKRADTRNVTNIRYSLNYTTIGLFTRCIWSPDNSVEQCFPNKYPATSLYGNCTWINCLTTNSNLLSYCGCDYTPSTKGIAACSIIAAIFLGLAFVILFIHSINPSETRSLGICLSIFPLILLLFAFIFILITLILIGSYLSRDAMHIVGYSTNGTDLNYFRTIVRDNYRVRVDWSSGLEIIALVLTFVSFILYALFVFKLGRE